MVGQRALCARTALGSGLLLVVGLSRVPSLAAEGADGATFPGAFGDAWATGAVEHVLTLSAAEAVLVLDREEPVGPEYYGGSSGPTPLRAGVAALLRSGAQLDFAGARTAEIVLGGAPATAVRWAYHLPGSGLPIPPELGQDELVLRGGRIHTYTRTPDPANWAARALALAATRGPWGGRALAPRHARGPAPRPTPKARRSAGLPHRGLGPWPRSSRSWGRSSSPRSRARTRGRGPTHQANTGDDPPRRRCPRWGVPRVRRRVPVPPGGGIA